MSENGPYYDPSQMSAKLRDMLIKGDTTELPKFIQEVLLQSFTNPLTQAILAPLAQSVLYPLSQHFGNTTGQNIKSDPTVHDAQPAAASNRLSPQLFEIHGFVIIRTVIPDDISEKDVKVLITSSHVNIKGDPSGNDHILPLPQGAKKEGATAAFKDRILEIRIPKETEIINADEINVEFL